MLSLSGLRWARPVALAAIALGLGLVTAAVIAFPTYAVADSATPTTSGCPQAPAAYTGTDTVVAALVSAQADADQSCAAETTALQAAAKADAPAQTVTVAQEGPETVTQVGTAATGTVAVSNFPADQQVADDPQTLHAVDAEFLGLHEDLWALSGIVVGVFTIGIVVWKVWP